MWTIPHTIENVSRQVVELKVGLDWPKIVVWPSYLAASKDLAKVDARTRAERLYFLGFLIGVTGRLHRPTGVGSGLTRRLQPVPWPQNIFVVLKFAAIYKRP
jgi:hypothetical protein